MSKVIIDNTDTKRIGIIRQVAAFFAIAVLITGIGTFISQRVMSTSAVKAGTESVAKAVATEVILSVKEYPAYDWLLSYWYEHPDDLDIEYDVEYYEGTVTEDKCNEFLKRHPGTFLKYMTTKEVEALSEEDRKMYAEIIYSWLTTRINQIKRTYNIDYLFCVIAKDDYKSQFFLLSAADEGAVRGDNYEEVYKLGKVVSVADNLGQQESMRDAVENAEHLAQAGNYMDYYAYLGDVDGNPAFVGLTYNLRDLNASIRSQTTRGTIYAVVLQLILSFICLVFISVFVLRPLRKVQKNIRLYKQNKDSAAIEENLSEVRSHNEIGELKEDVISLSKELDNYMYEVGRITAEKQRISAELDLAAKIQANTLPNNFPPFPDRKDFDIFATMEPAKEVGGDFYDFFMMDDDHLALVMADVSGKGVPAALFMMVSMIQVQNSATNFISPGKVLEVVNEQIISHNPEEMFVSIWLGVLNLKTGLLTASNAGHEYPAIMQPDGKFELIKDQHGFVVGGMEGMKYKEYTIQLKPGSKLFVYTDGVPEATDKDNKMFGTKRMIDALNKDPNASPEQLLQYVKESVDEFVQEAQQFDDLTMMCLSYHGKKK